MGERRSLQNEHVVEIISPSLLFSRTWQRRASSTKHRYKLAFPDAAKFNNIYIYFFSQKTRGKIKILSIVHCCYYYYLLINNNNNNREEGTLGKKGGKETYTQKARKSLLHSRGTTGTGSAASKAPLPLSFTRNRPASWLVGKVISIAHTLCPTLGRTQSLHPPSLSIRFFFFRHCRYRRDTSAAQRKNHTP